MRWRATEHITRIRSVCSSRRGRTERGYALLMVCFLAALAIIASWAAVPNLLTQSRREKEEEMIWRGEQYARAVRLFYRKNGRFPQSIEELVEKKTNIRYLRASYADPMNTKDGSWRLLYVGPSGQIIGSVRAAPVRGALGGLPPGSGVTTGPRLDDRPGSEQRPAATSGPPPIVAKAPSATERVFGGNIIGVGSKIDRPSLKVYKGGTTYREWEFFWDIASEAGLRGIPGQPEAPPGKTGAPPARPR